MTKLYLVWVWFLPPSGPEALSGVTLVAPTTFGVTKIISGTAESKLHHIFTIIGIVPATPEHCFVDIHPQQKCK